MKKSILALSLLVLLGASSCARRYTCPTYLKNSSNPQDVRAKAPVQTLDASKN